MTEDIEPFIKENFPNSEFDVITEINLHKLVILDKSNSINKDNIDSKMVSTLGSFYKSYYISSIESPRETKLMILYESETLKWESKTYDLFELGEMYNLVEE